ncbi:MAG TPA: DUF4238 domain-containing protein [Magnetospirillaceae bacterium]|nr:DUF4238 domain-containing protein [Magnetospirillaceae bacterium]
MIQHLVSRILLRRFAKHKRGPISGLDLHSLEQRTDKVENFGGIQDVDTDAPDDAEKRWSKEVESRLPHAFELLDQGKLLSDPIATTTIKKCIALHWARGFAAREVVDKILIPGTTQKAITAILERFTLEQAAFGLTDGRTSNMSEQALYEIIHTEFAEKLRRERYLDVAFLELYRKGQSFIESKSLEIWHSPNEEFLLGDIPVVTYEKDTGKVGILDDVSWSKADAIFMPLGPRHVVALAKEPAYREADARTVEILNTCQVKVALKEVYFRPGSGLGDLIAGALKK